MSNPLLSEKKPVVAVLTVDDNDRLFRGNRNNFRDLVKTGQELDCPVYIVTARDLKLGAKRVQGYLFHSEEKTWKKHWFPLPDVIYNRIPLREDERKPEVRRKIEEVLQHESIQLFNPFFFNKRRLFEWLKKGRSTRTLVPDTKKMMGPKTLNAMLEKYGSLYLKPESGKAGKGIMLLRLDPDDLKPYRLTIQGKRRRNVVYKTAKLPLLWKRIKREAGTTPYIMQESIELTSYRGRHFDMRVLVQKNGKGLWMVTGIGARLAGPKRITTHVPQGGSIEDPEKMLLPAFGADMTALLLSRIKSSSLLIAKQIEKESGFLLGEMSMDLGVDTNGRLWFFEANAKPMKFDEPHIRKKSLERIFQYSQYLSRQPKFKA
ncbi:YheC/YheD family endospore coat-associated protein [Paenibacillus phocaensis]|uniref:YheC/YheD family endospore coat-associated protein n=1 Tax=Paenibacillus phocaensis TaxID=1776378 RepID=UPI00039B935B|nr:YheC/YheD family protein [Paenibacillus phocaensis]